MEKMKHYVPALALLVLSAAFLSSAIHASLSSITPANQSAAAGNAQTPSAGVLTYQILGLLSSDGTTLSFHIPPDTAIPPGVYSLSVATDRSIPGNSLAFVILPGAPGNSTAFNMGDIARLTSNVDLHVLPSLTSRVVFSATVGMKGTISGGPVANDDSTWWYVTMLAQGKSGWVNENFIANEGLGIADTTGPTIPVITAPADGTVLSVRDGGRANGQVAINLKWSRSTDDQNRVGYRLYRNGVSVAGATSGGTDVLAAYTDHVPSNTYAIYTYTVEAYDSSPARNLSGKSSPVKITVLADRAAIPAPSTPFAIGDTVIATANLNVRSDPGLDASIIDELPKGELGQVVDGPISGQNNLVWWKINWDRTGTIGWAAQSNLTRNNQPVIITSPEAGETLNLASPKIIYWQYPSELAGKSVNVTVSLLRPDRSKTWIVYQHADVAISSVFIPSGGDVPLRAGAPSGQYFLEVTLIDGLGRTYVGKSGLFNIINELAPQVVPVPQARPSPSVGVPNPTPTPYY